MTSPHVTRFASKVDAWVFALLLAAILVALAAAVRLWAEGGDEPIVLWLVWVLIGPAPGVGLPLWVLCATDYQIDQRELLVRCGPYRERIPVADIHSVTPSRSLLTSFALSLDGLCIRYRRAGKVQGEVLVSPKDKQAFVQALQAINPAIIHKEQE